MLETKFKIVFLLTVLALAAIPIAGIMRGTTPTPFEEPLSDTADDVQPEIDASSKEEPIPNEMITIPAGPFIRGTLNGGFDEQPQRTIVLDSFLIDRHEVTNHFYQQFVTTTGHRKAAPPARYVKSIGKMRGVNQPAVYVSWNDAEEYCRWRGKRLPTEAEWEKAMRGTDGRMWPWGNEERPHGANWARVQDGYDVTAPIGNFSADVSPYGVMDGAGNVLEWVADWYQEVYYKESPETNPPGSEYGTYRVLRGGSFTTTGADIRITSRSKMMPDFRDETIGFRCASSNNPGEEKQEKKSDATENQNSKESKTRPR